MNQQRSVTMTTNNLRSVVTAMALSTICAAPAFAIGPKSVRVDREQLAKLSPEDQKNVLRIADRLETITNTDRTELDRTERIALRSEVKALKNEADAYNRGGGTVIYISTAGIIIILLILIILL